jgi:hypothetical protein
MPFFRQGIRIGRTGAHDAEGRGSDFDGLFATLGFDERTRDLDGTTSSDFVNF